MYKPLYRKHRISPHEFLSPLLGLFLLASGILSWRNIYVDNTMFLLIIVQILGGIALNIRFFIMLITSSKIWAKISDNQFIIQKKIYNLELLECIDNTEKKLKLRYGNEIISLKKNELSSDDLVELFEILSIRGVIAINEVKL